MHQPHTKMTAGTGLCNRRWPGKSRPWKRRIGGILGLWGWCLTVKGQVLLYQENFPWPGAAGNQPITTCGWNNAIPNNPNRLYQLSATNGAVYAYQAVADVPATTAFFTMTTLDTGTTGMAFPNLDPTQFRGLTLAADIQPGYQPDGSAAADGGAISSVLVNNTATTISFTINSTAPMASYIFFGIELQIVGQAGRGYTG